MFSIDFRRPPGATMEFWCRASNANIYHVSAFDTNDEHRIPFQIDSIVFNGIERRLGYKKALESIDCWKTKII